MHRRPFSWVALVGIGLAGVVAVSAATALAARSAASPFELVAIDRYEGACLPFCEPAEAEHVGEKFTSGAPFCEAGTVADVGSGPRGELFRRYTCTEDGGSLTLAEHEGPPGRGEWTIVEGSGCYAGLRGKGSYSSEFLTEDRAIGWRTTLRGFADHDSVTPSVAFTSASATKLRGVPVAYAIRVALSLRDDVEANTVAYALRVKEGPEHARDRRLPELERTEGTTAAGSISTAVRVWPSSKRVRNVQLLLSGWDPVGNEVSIARWLTLPR
jgi:hypothetical protein